MPCTTVTVVLGAGRRIRRSASDALVAAGFTVAATCPDLDATLAAVARHHPDVCVLDRDLPGGGLAAIAAIATPGRQPKVIVVGGGESAAEVRAVRLAGAADCLPGEIDTERLAAAVTRQTKRSDTT
jgi:DNA-binding NarL/FixJ family response regulator